MSVNVLHCLRQTFSLTGCPVSIPAVPVPLPHPAGQVHIGIALHIHIGHFLTRFSRREGGRAVDKTVENKKFSSDRLPPYFLCKHDSVSLENLCRTLTFIFYLNTPIPSYKWREETNFHLRQWLYLRNASLVAICDTRHNSGKSVHLWNWSKLLWHQLWAFMAKRDQLCDGKSSEMAMRQMFWYKMVRETQEAET